MGAFSKQALGSQYNNFSDELMAQLFPHGFEEDDNEVTTDVQTLESGVPHEMVRVDEQEMQALYAMGGSGEKGPDGIRSFNRFTDTLKDMTDGGGFGGSGSESYFGSHTDYAATDAGMNDTHSSAYGDYNYGPSESSYLYSSPNSTSSTSSTSLTNGTNSTSNPAATVAAGPTAAETEAAAEATKRTSALAGLTGEYTAYNSSVDAFNKNFDTYQGMYDADSGTINNAGIANIYDDPLTDEDENYYTQFGSSFTDAADDLNSFSLSNMPTLSSGDYTFTADELPTLLEAKDYSGLAGNFSGLQSTLDGLNRGRTDEVGRINSTAAGLNTDLGTVAYDINQLQNTDGTYNLSKAGGTDNINRLMFNANRDRNNFSSDILGQMDNPFATFDTGYTTANTTLDGFNTAVGTEQKRIDDFDETLFDYSDEVRGVDSLGGYDLTSGADLDTLKRQIDEKQRLAGRFNSQMGYDFSDGLLEIQNLENQLDGLIGDRNKEQGLIDSYRKSIGSSTGGFSDDASDLGIADLTDINSLQGQIDKLKRQAGRFENPLTFDFSDLTGEGSDLAAVETSLQGLRDDRGTEEARIGTEGTRIAGLYDDYSDLFGGDAENDIAGLNISNLSELEDLRRKIDAAQLGASRFESDLSTSEDFRYPLEDLGTLEGKVDNMFIDRGDELTRIDLAQKAGGLASGASQKAATNGNYYSQAALDAIQENITTGQKNITDFESLLDYSFGAEGEDGTAIQDFIDAQGLLDDLTSKRTTEVDDIRDGIVGATEGLDELNPYDEELMDDMLKALGVSAGDLNAFSGGRVSDLRKNITTGKKSVNSKLDTLYEARDDYEADALEMLTDLDESDYSRANYDEYAGLIEPLRKNIDLYDATQAGDEITSIDNEMARRLGLVEADELAVQTRLGNDASDYGFTDDYALTDPLTEAGYYNLYGEEEEELDEFGNPIGSTFSTNVRAA